MLILGEYGKTLAPTLGADHAAIDELSQQQYGTIISPWNMLPRRKLRARHRLEEKAIFYVRASIEERHK